MLVNEAMTNTSKSHKRCPACGSSNPITAWECEMCGTSFSDVKPPKSVQQADAKSKSSAAAQRKAPSPQSPPAKTASTSAAQSGPARPATKTNNGSSAPKAATTATKGATETFNTPIKTTGSMKKPAPLYARKSRFGLGSLVALVFIAAFGIAAIVFGMNALQGSAPTAPAQPIAVTLSPADTTTPTAATTDLPVAAPTEAPIEAPAVAPTQDVTPEPAETATTEPAPEPSPTTATQPTATPDATKTPAATAAPLDTGATITYTVKAGDTCGAVAKRLEVTVAQIIQQNKLDERCFLRVNQVLTITR